MFSKARKTSAGAKKTAMFPKELHLARPSPAKLFRYVERYVEIRLVSCK